MIPEVPRGRKQLHIFEIKLYLDTGARHEGKQLNPPFLLFELASRAVAVTAELPKYSISIASCLRSNYHESWHMQ